MNNYSYERQLANQKLNWLVSCPRLEFFEAYFEAHKLCFLSFGLMKSRMSNVCYSLKVDGQGL